MEFLSHQPPVWCGQPVAHLGVCSRYAGPGPLGHQLLQLPAAGEPAQTLPHRPQLCLDVCLYPPSAAVSASWHKVRFVSCYRLCCDALTSNNSWCRKQMIKENRRVASPHSITSSQTNPTRRFLFVHLQQPHQCQKGEQSEQQRFLRWPLEKLPDSLLQLRLFLLLNVFLLILHLRLRPLLPAWDAGVYAGQRLQLRFQGRKNTLKLRMTVQNKALTVQ